MFQYKLLETTLLHYIYKWELLETIFLHYSSSSSVPLHWYWQLYYILYSGIKVFLYDSIVPLQWYWELVETIFLHNISSIVQYCSIVPLQCYWVLYNSSTFWKLYSCTIVLVLCHCNSIGKQRRLLFHQWDPAGGLVGDRKRHIDVIIIFIAIFIVIIIIFIIIIRILIVL